MYETGEEEIGPSLAMARMNRGIVMANERKQTMTTSDGIDWKPRAEDLPPPLPFVKCGVREDQWWRGCELPHGHDGPHRDEPEPAKMVKCPEPPPPTWEHISLLQERNEKQRKEIVELQSKLKVSEGELGDLHAHVDTVLFERDAARIEITKLTEQIAYQRDLRLHDVRVADGARDLAEKAGQKARRQLLAAQAEVESLRKELDEAKAELARELGGIRQRFSAGSVLIDCGNALDASPNDCRSREGIWFPDGKGTKLCYRCLVRQSQRCREELQKAEAANAELLAKRAIDAGGESLPTGRRIVLTPMLETEKLAIRIKELERSLETLRNEVKGGRWG